MNGINPIVEYVKTNEGNKKSKDIKYPIKIYCIVDDISDASRNLLLREIKNHAINSGVIYTTREYDSYKFSNDRDVIQRLPAFHAYINKSYNRTFYSNTRPLDHINECIKIHLNNEEKKIRRIQRWKNLYESFKNWINRLTYRDTAMKRYEREQTNISNNLHKARISNWN
jgi:hypothetical protein